MSTAATVSCQCWFLDPRCRLVPGVWSYQAADPLVVTLVLRPTDGSGTRRWSWSRSLLAAAFLAPSGEGDVHLHRSALGRLVVRLSSAEGDVELSCLLEPVWELLSKTVQVCPPCRGGPCGPCGQCVLVRRALDTELAGIVRGALS